MFSSFFAILSGLSFFCFLFLRTVLFGFIEIKLLLSSFLLSIEIIISSFSSFFCFISLLLLLLSFFNFSFFSFCLFKFNFFISLIFFSAFLLLFKLIFDVLRLMFSLCFSFMISLISVGCISNSSFLFISISEFF